MIEDDSEGPHIGLKIIVLTANDFWGSEACITENATCLLVFAQKCRLVKAIDLWISQSEVANFGQKNPFRRKISEHYAELMQLLDSLSEIGGHLLDIPL